MTSSNSDACGLFSENEWLFFQNCLRPMRGTFGDVARQFGLIPYAGRLWPFLGLRMAGLLCNRQLELMLHPEFVREHKVVFDLRFVETRRFGGQVKREFCCGRYDVPDFADSEYMQHQIRSKLCLLDMIQIPTQELFLTVHQDLKRA